MKSETFLNDRVTLHCGDCLDALRQLPDCSVDSVVTDPPYHLTSIVKRFGGKGAAEAKAGKTGAYKRASAGFMGKQWDGGDIAFTVELWAEVLRVLKPGGYLVAFSGTRTYHRMACAIDDAGFDIRDQIGWAFGSGFPKSHDVSKALDKRLGAEREKVRVDNPRNPKATGGGRDGKKGATRPWIEAAMERGYHEKDSNDPVTDEAAQWQGWGTALKPAWEPVCLARKPLDGTVAENVLQYGTGGLNIDGCRVGSLGGTAKARSSEKSKTDSVGGHLNAKAGAPIDSGRWPANLIHDGSDEVCAAFPETNSQRSVVKSKPGSVSVNGAGLPSHEGEYGFDDSGSASRFFYSAKADADDRIGSKHPTVKPVDLMQYLVRLVTPPGGTVLDPFAGTGTTGEAAWREGFNAVLIEREAEYQADIAERMRLCMAGPDEKRREIIKRRGLEADAGPLFGGTETVEIGGGG